MTTSNAGPVGPFRYIVASDTWWWSDAVYEIHGFVPGEVVPSAELILSHKHPEDAVKAARILESALARGGQFAFWHRIIDAQERVRQVITVGGGVHDHQGRLEEVRGYLVDVTDPLRDTTAKQIDDAVRASAETRDVIEQVKGALMVTYAIGAEEAFGVLRRFSQETNVKVRDLAKVLMEVITRTGHLPGAVRAGLDAMRVDGADPRRYDGSGASASHDGTGPEATLAD